LYHQAVPTTVNQGLIGGQTAAPKVTAPTTAGSTATIDRSSLTAPTVTSDMTVAGQVEGIIAKDSPLMQQAATRARQAMNGRGLVNSSMAVGAGQAALYDAAAPIARQDAQTHASFASQAFDAQTAAARQDAQNRNDNVRLDASLVQQASLANQEMAVRQSTERYQASVQSALANADAATRLQLQQIDAQTRQTLAETEARYRTSMQTSDSMARSYQSMIDSITRVMSDPNLDAAGRQAAITNITELYQGSLGIQEQISGLDLGDILAEGGALVEVPDAPENRQNPNDPSNPGGYYGNPNGGDVGGY
jgi:hypothetical protein